MKLDPYRTLGVNPDADKAAIKRAYRRAAQHAHPDIPGGSATRFALVKTAYDTLSDDGRRRHYDQTGEIEEKPVDNKRTDALQCVATALEAAIASCEANGQDPEMVDMVGRMKGWIEANIRDTATLISRAETGLRKNEAIAERFSGGEMEAIMRGRMAAINARIANMRRNIETGKFALELMAELTYRADDPPPRPSPAMMNLANVLRGF